ncbi:DUF2142 domain-containing protein [Planosporangium flavigriseum]|uniref:DUF2142 domain-containing protein n=1 Tax=Planosporangium flavigriseum TaxID=373681 RepID=UPI00143C3F1A|nr:DUF2142 domain-containing protein [Planosporangium flavigriseum]NJC64451.1 DUF2142 domain-containing protein [Planosporangium flavigriseum]
MAVCEPTSSHGGRLAALVRGRRLWFIAFLGFFMISTAWALAMPFGGVPDEGNYITRAAGAGRGEFLGELASSAEGAGAFHHVKRGLMVDNMCWQGNAQKSAECGLQPTGKDDIVRLHTTAGRYPPAYFAAVGWPLTIWPTWTGIWLARLIGAAIASAFLASAMFAAVRWTRHPLLPAAVIVAVTPITLHISGGVNPNGVEIAAGLAFMVGLAAIALDRRPTAPPAVYTLIGVSALTLTAVRPFGPLWTLAIIGICFVPTTRKRLRRVLTNRRVLAWLAALAVVLIASVTWSIAVETGKPGWVAAMDITPEEALRVELFGRLQQYANEMVGVMSWLDAPLPGLAYVAWFMAFGLLFLGGFALGEWHYRWRIAALTLAAFGVMVIPDALNARTYGFYAQGRYVLPIAVGLPILAAYALGERRALVGTQARSIIRTFALLLIPIHFLALYNTMLRWQYGIRWPKIKVNPFHGEWLPRLGPELPLALGAVGVLVLLVTAWAVSSAVHPAEPRTDDQSDADDRVALASSRAATA